MKIGQQPDRRLTDASTVLPKAGQNTPANRATDKAPATKGASVTVSKLAQSVSTSALASSDIDTGKVESIRTAIANGSYKVNAEAIADKLLSNAKEVLQRPQH